LISHLRIHDNLSVKMSCDLYTGTFFMTRTVTAKSYSTWLCVVVYDFPVFN